MSNPAIKNMLHRGLILLLKASIKKSRWIEYTTEIVYIKHANSASRRCDFTIESVHIKNI